MKNVIKIALVLLIIIILIFAIKIFLVGSGNGWVCQDGIWIKRGNHNKPIPAEDCGDIQNEPTITYHNASEDLIQIESPLPDANVNQEFNITGQARGYWFFEASFPIQILDKDKNILATAIAQAEPDPTTGEINWMTEDFVSFKAHIKLPENYIGPATIILNKDNPSGLSENEASASFLINIGS